jgi:hypothetical protein
LALILAGLLALAAPGIVSAAEAGKFQFVSGSVKVVSAAGVERTAAKGDAFNPGDTVVTGPASSAQIRMTDGGLMAIRADTQMKLDQYVFSGREDGTERKLVSLIKGGFRTITGLIGNRNKDNYKIFTPSATIGIRGTDHEPVVIPPGTVGVQAGTYDRVYRGATVIETDKGKLIVNPNQVGFTPGKGVAPVLLPKIPDFYDTKPGKPDVAKEPQKDSKESSDDGATTGEKTRSTTSTRSLSTLKSEAVKDTGDSSSAKESAATLRSPLEASSVKDLDTLKSDTLGTPLTDTTVKSTATTTIKDTTSSTLKSEVLTTPTTTLKSTETLTVPVTTTIRAPTTTTTTTVAPITSTITKPVTTTITAPTTTTVTKPVTSTVTTTVPRTVETITAPVTTTIKK